MFGHYCTICGAKLLTWKALAEHILSQNDDGHKSSYKWASRFLGQIPRDDSKRYDFIEKARLARIAKPSTACRVCHKPYEGTSGDPNKVCQC